jgi:hypothetical protein
MMIVRHERDANSRARRMAAFFSSPSISTTGAYQRVSDSYYQARNNKQKIAHDDSQGDTDSGFEEWLPTPLQYCESRAQFNGA